MREKFDAVLTCGCPTALKSEVEQLAARVRLSLADFTRRAVMADLHNRK